MSSPQWSSQSVPAFVPSVPVDASRRPTKKSATAVGLAALALAGAALAATTGLGRGSGVAETAATTAADLAQINPAEPGGEANGPAVAIGATDTTQESDATTPESTDQDTDTSAPATPTEQQSGDSATGDTENESATASLVGPTRRAVMSGGIVYLRGSVPSQEVADAIQAKAAAVLGPDRVVVEYVIDPTVELSPSAPLVVEDVILFEYGSASINPQFYPLLDLGIALMYQTPSVVITVVGHTDSDGSSEFNQQLSEARTAAVIRYWVANGVAEHQYEGLSFGETQPVTDDSSDAGAQSNRRVEFIISGLLD